LEKKKKDTYAGAGTHWGNRLENVIDQVGVEKLGVGLETIDPNTNSPISDELVCHLIVSNVLLQLNSSVVIVAF
jgi:hypothetical protein